MREIKFRAWVNNSKKFEAIEFIGAGQRTFPVYTKGNKYWFPMQGVLEQYTGLKDKNSVDVYEGDYIKAKSTIYKIEWFNTAFWAIPESGYGSSQPISSLYEYEDGMAYKVEVIGNIHENPDLLEEQ